MPMDVPDVSVLGRSARELNAAAAADGSVLVVPVGSVEQHGRHLPVATDTLLARETAILGAEAAADDGVPALVTPPLWVGFSPHHAGFGGTVTGSFETLLAHLEDVAASGFALGFDAVLFLNGHGGNGPLVEAAVGTVGAAHPEGQALALTYFELAAAFEDEVRESDVGGMAHGGEFETSLMLALYPDLVDVDAAAATVWEEPYDLAGDDLLHGGPLSVYRPFEAYSASGAIGDVNAASAETGRDVAARLTDALGALLADVHAENR